VEDCLRDRYTRDMLEQRITDKFGSVPMETALAVATRTTDDDGVELSHDERKDDYLERLKDAPERARWVCAADAIQTSSTILADLHRTIDPDSVWQRFHWGKSGTIRWFRRVYDRLCERGFTAPIMQEFEYVVHAMERHESVPNSSGAI